MINNQEQMELAIVKSLVESGDCPVKNMPIDISRPDRHCWYLVVYNVDLAGLSGEQGVALYNWLIDTSRKAKEDYGINLYVVRQEWK